MNLLQMPKEIIGEISSRFNEYREIVSRMLFWGWHMRKSYDFDSHTIYDMLHLKLKRIYHSHLNHNHCVWNSSPEKVRMRRLAECIELCGRLSEDEYALDLCVEPLNDKWGNLDFNPGKVLVFNRTGVKTEEDRMLYKRDLKRLMDVAHRRKIEQKKRFWNLLETHVEYWWD